MNRRNHRCFYILVTILALRQGLREGDASFFLLLIAAGRHITSESVATGLVPGDTNGIEDIFVRYRQTGTTWLVSKN